VVVGVAIAAVTLTIAFLASDSISDWIIGGIWLFLGEFVHFVSSSLSHIGPFHQRVDYTNAGARQDRPDFLDLDSVSTTRSKNIFGLILIGFGRMVFIYLVLV